MTQDNIDAICADMFCAQVQTNCDMGDSVFNHEIYPDLMGDDYADAIMEGIVY